MKTTLLITSAALLLSSSLAQAGLYRWVDEKGEIHFSDKVPAAASRKVVSEMSRHGGVKKTRDPEAAARAKSELEANAAAIAKEEAIRKEKEKKLAEFRKRDDFLLATYENKEEIAKSFITKIKLLKGNATILKAQNAVLKKKLDKLLTSKSATKNQAKKIVSITKTIEQYRLALQQNEEERVNISKNYKSDLKRYTELTQ